MEECWKRKELEVKTWNALQDALFGVFQYFIGNTDFSVAGLHNVELFFNEQGDVMPIAYDLDSPER